VKPAPLERRTGVTRLDDPRIGIEDAELAELVYALCSRLTGKMKGWRAQLERYARLISGMAVVELTGSDPRPALCSDLAPLGWPDPKRMLRKRWRLEPYDLDKAWSRSIKLEGEERLGRIDLELLTTLLPADLWRPLALLIEEGPVLAGRRFERWMRLVAAGEAPCRSALGKASLSGAQSNFRKLFSHLQWLLRSDPAFAELAERWHDLPPPLDIDDLEASSAERDTLPMPRRDARQAFFRAVQELEQLAAKSIWDSNLNQLKPLRNIALHAMLTTVGPRVESLTSMTVSPQKREDGTYRTGGYLREYECPWDHVIRPALLFANLKGQRDKFVVKVIPEELAAHFDRYLGYVGIADEPTYPMWVSEWQFFHRSSGARLTRTEYQYARKAGREHIIARPRADPSMGDNSIRYAMSVVMDDFSDRDNPHAARKLAFLLAPEAVAVHLAEGGKRPEGALDGYAPGHILLDHRLKELSEIYAGLADVNSPLRQEISWIVASRNYELLYGDRGATFGLDVEAICAARELLSAAESQLEASRLQAEELSAEIRALQAEEHASQGRYLELRSRLRDMRAVALEHGAEKMDEGEFRRTMLLGQEVDDERDQALRLERSLVETRDAARAELTRLTRANADAKQALNEAVAARIPLREPVEEEPDLDAQLQELLADVPPGDGTDALLVRDLLTFTEYASAMGVQSEALRVHIWKARKAGRELFFPADDKRNSWFQPLDEIMVEHTNFRFFKWSTMAKEKYTAAQLAEFRKTLSKPVTNPRWKGAYEAVMAAECV
jgi:hypothetical protein